MLHSMNTDKKIEIRADILQKILDHSPNEIYVLDKEARIVYVNKACEQHYGLSLNDVVGKPNDEMLEKGYWTPSILPLIFKEKKPVTMKQITYVGKELISTAIPILNDDAEIELLVVTAQEPAYAKLNIPDQESEENTYGEDLSSPQIITTSPKMKNVVRFCEKVASVDTTILIQGESGTGKGLLAQYIHQKSNRSEKPFLSINCAAIPEELLESELFGYVKGAFTGASKTGKKGLLEVANHGTIFLDEIGEISPRIQAKLLQVIQDKEFFPIGGQEVKKVDIRIIAATNRNLYEMVEHKKFREDLYYRLRVIDVHIPSLRERKEDIIPLTYYFLNAFNQKYDVNRLILQDALDVFRQYSWPGNVRELENMIERLVVTSDSAIQSSHLPDLLLQHARPKPTPAVGTSLDTALEETERALVRHSYQKLHTSRKVAADLGISQTRASKLIRKYCTGVSTP